MSIFYKSERIGKDGKPFVMYKLRTLKESVDIGSSFAQSEQYTKIGRFLRKIKLDELPQLWNVIKGEMDLFGYRPEEAKIFCFFPEAIQEILKQYKPGIIDLSSLHFFNEEQILQINGDPYKTYWEKIRPIKLALQMFYIQNRCWLLNLTIVYLFLKKISWSLITRK